MSTGSQKSAIYFWLGYHVFAGTLDIIDRVAKACKPCKLVGAIFLAGAIFWEKHAKNYAIMSMAHITYTIAH